MIGVFLGYLLAIEAKDQTAFRVPYFNSSKLEVEIAQAELCRFGIDCEVDGVFGKQTAFAVCEYLNGKQ